MRCAVLALLAVCSIAALASCPYPNLPSAGPRETREFPIQSNRDVDLLFLIDDSSSMSDKQANLAANFSKLIAVLDALPGGLPNLHIGITTSDLGTKGVDDPAPGPPVGGGPSTCRDLGKNGALQLYGAPVTGSPYVIDIADAAGNRMRNYTGNLSDVFAQIAKGAGANGCGFEQTLGAVQRALDPDNTANRGFVRPDAYLGVMIITDEDDCSLSHSALITPDPGMVAMFGELQSFRCTRFGIVCDQGGKTADEMNQPGPKAACHADDSSPYLTKVSDHVAFLRNLKPDPSKLFVAAIAGPTEPFATELRTVTGFPKPIMGLAHSCTYVDGVGAAEVADPPVRIQAFLDQFQDRSAFSPICQRDLSGGLQAFGDLLKAAIGDPCIAGTLADVNLGTPGAQHECAVTVITKRDQPRPTETSLARCSPDDATARNKPCWRLVTDAASCPAGDHVLVKVEGDDQLASDARIRASCVIEPTP
jgi:hypothetical protein